MSRNLEISFGALSPSLSEQLSKQGLEASEPLLSLLEQDVNELNRLRIRGYINDSTSDRGRKKIMAQLTKIVRFKETP